MKITPTTLTINQLLGSGNEQFIIPAYQRRYSWGEKQWSDLFNDIKLLSQQDSHLLGTILCLTSNYAVGINQLELVDGQQRTTTLTLLLKALSDKFTKLKLDELHKEINSLLYCKGLDRVLKRKVILGDLDNLDYEKFMKNEDLNTIKNQKIIEGYNFFMQKLNELDLTELLEYHYKLVNNTYTIRLDVGNAKDAYKLFETINNRGLSLSPTDIIKNFLLGHSSLIDDNTLEKVKGSWTELIINLDGIKTDDFFRQYLSSQLKRKITGSTIIDEFKKYYFESVIEAENLNEFSQYEHPRNLETDEEELEETHVDDEIVSATANSEHHKISIIDFAKRLRDASKIYGQIRNQLFTNVNINNHLNNLTKIKSFPSYIFLIDLFQRNVEDTKKLEILKLIETFMLRRHICEYRTGELDAIFANLVSVENENIIENIKEKLLKHFPSDNEFRDKFYRYNFRGNENRAKYVLETFEYDLIKDQGEYVLTSGGELHLEHIIPQKITTKKSKEEFGNWEIYLGTNAKEQHMKYVNRIGNFTLIAKKLNIIASNNPYKNKVKEYQKSNIHLTKMLTNLDEFKIQQVKDRSTEFATKAVQLWSF
ncbi:uncharacterized protein with ParB-like and HNH nuclease domain [Peribacillus frigoritolerans]|uniref:DUF262 domain-containing protein n=1 Tax=Peribacillus frigoritolerans TaxID=450367 RepID=UPI00209ED0C7|nr:DUF262 domain-containing protein [Peribacillus frigoritolerans]MCP1495100.1 uncharacterized protein with ParB-like and HNH nuclease domain [Peribacillus frigoritolerans]